MVTLLIGRKECIHGECGHDPSQDLDPLEKSKRYKGVGDIHYKYLGPAER